MTVARNLLEDLAVIGATIKPAGDRLILRAGRIAIPAELVSRIRAAKTDLLTTLSMGADRPGGEDARAQDRPASTHTAIEPQISEWLNQHPAPSRPGALRMVRSIGIAKYSCSSIWNRARNAHMASFRLLARLASSEDG
jgi:hypothetical protein